jgi:nicotinamidase-related amidase
MLLWSVIDMRHPNILTRDGAVLVIFEMQERLVPAVHERKMVLNNIINMAAAAKILKIPIILTEQYPKGLGATVPELVEVLGEDVKSIEKLSFSAFGSEEFKKRLDELKAKTLILCGLECHICINQTALDGVQEGFMVHVLADGVSSRTKENLEIGLEKIRQGGGIVTTTEMALYELMEVAKTEEFNSVLKVLR